MSEDNEGFVPPIQVFNWQTYWASSGYDVEDERELAFLDMAVRQFRDWEPERVGRVLRYLIERTQGAKA